VFDRSKRILRYINSESRSIVIEKESAKTLSKIAFVPVDYPVSVEPGGFVVYEKRIVRFDQTVSHEFGRLRFTKVPVLDKDLCPAQIYHSHLKIAIPTLGDVFEHLVALISYGDSLDRWNTTKYSIKYTFIGVFQFFKDNWNSPLFTAEMKDVLKRSALIPLIPESDKLKGGQKSTSDVLIKPERLFFKLQLDLSPFLHEVPKAFGNFESIFKSLGVRE
jgi:hypothetical protein